MTNKKYRLLIVLPAKKDGIDSREGELRLERINSSKDADNIAYFAPGAYEKIFLKKRREDSFGKKKLAVVKIQYKDNPPIYRAYEGVITRDFGIHDIGLSPSSIRLLTPEGTINPQKEDFEVTVTEGTKNEYLKYHPDPVVSTSYRSSKRADYLGLISIFLGAVSVIASWDNLVKIVESALALFGF